MWSKWSLNGYEKNRRLFYMNSTYSYKNIFLNFLKDSFFTLQVT